MQAPTPSTLALVALMPLLAWRIYARFRRAVGRQRLSRARPWITLSIFSLVVVLLAFFAREHVERLGWLAAGLAAGWLLALYGLHLTSFEPTPEGLFYTPNAYLGIALSLIFFGRMLYRLVEVYAITRTAAPRPPSFARSPFTPAVFGILAGYYIAYSIQLVRWRKGVLRTGLERGSLANEG